MNAQENVNMKKVKQEATDTAASLTIANPAPSAEQDAKGNGAMHGGSYHIRITLVMMLRWFDMHRKDRSFDFKITMEDPEGGKFDDVVLDYRSTQLPAGRIYIQAKHKQEKATHHIKDSDLLAAYSSDGAFSIPKYFISFLENKQRLSTELTDVSYALCTNSNVMAKSGEYLTPRQLSDDDIYTFVGDMGATCYSFTGRNSLKKLDEKLRDSGCISLGKLMARDVYRRKQVACFMFKPYGALIARCIECVGLDSSTSGSRYKFKNVVLTAKETTAVGKFRTAFLTQYKNCLGIAKDSPDAKVWSDLKGKGIMIEPELFARHTSTKFSAGGWPEMDDEIDNFYSSFLLICDTASEDELLPSAMKLMPTWAVDEKSKIFDKLHTMMFDALKSERPDPFSLELVKKWFVDADSSSITNKLRISTREYLKTLGIKYPYIRIECRRLTNSKLYEFSSNDATNAGVYQYSSPYGIELITLIVAQTLALVQKDVIFLRSELYGNKTEMMDDLDHVLSYIHDVDHPSYKVLVMVGNVEQDGRNEINELMVKYERKLIILDESDQRLPETGLLLRDLTPEGRKWISERYANFKLFGTVCSQHANSPTDTIVHDEDDIKYVIELMSFSDQSVKYNLNKNNFDEIKLSYVQRELTVDGQGQISDGLWFKSELEETLRDQDVSFDSATYFYQDACNVERIQSAILEEDHSSSTTNLDGIEKMTILLNDAGCGKSTYFTWLSFYLQSQDESLLVIKFNAIEYSSDFVILTSIDVNNLSDDDIVRILYRFVHVFFVVRSVNLTTIKKMNVVRNEADRCSALLSIVNGLIVLDEVEAKKLEPRQLMELRLFREKFNAKQLVLLLDGFDEVAPIYKEVVLKLFVRFSHFENISKMYLSSRPYDFEDELRTSFPGCKIYNLRLFTVNEQLLFIHKYLLRNLEDYGRCDENHRYIVTYLFYNRIRGALGDSKSIPFLLFLASSNLLPKLKEVIHFRTKTICTQTFEQKHISKLSVFETFIDNKLQNFITEKMGSTDTAALTTAAELVQRQLKKKMKKQHALLAMYVIFDDHRRAQLISKVEARKATRYMQEVVDAQKTMGILEGVHAGIPLFNHRMFAEYFAACWLWRIKDRLRNKDFVESGILFEYDMEEVRMFLDMIITEDQNGTGIHMAVLNGSIERVEELLLTVPSVASTRDAAGRLPLHLAIVQALHSRTNEKIVEKLIKNTPVNELFYQDNLFLWSTVDYLLLFQKQKSLNQEHTNIKTMLLTAVTYINIEAMCHEVFKYSTLNHIINKGDGFVRILKFVDSTREAAKISDLVVNHLIEDKKLDMSTRHDELESLTVLEYFSKRNMCDMMRSLVAKLGKLPPDLVDRLFQIAFDNQANDVIIFLIAECNCRPSRIANKRGLIAALQYTLEQNLLPSFQIIFHEFCLQTNTSCIDDSQIAELKLDVKKFEDDLADGSCCCVLSDKNVKLSLPEYRKTVIEDAYVIETLLARGVGLGNTQTVHYIIQKTNMKVTNGLIVMIMRLLPKGNNISHFRSISTFRYLLKKTDDPYSVDEMGRNLLHMTAQNGCFYMLQCLIDTGFNLMLRNRTNQWSVFHYCSSNDYERTIYSTLVILDNGKMVHFDKLDAIMHNEMTDLTTSGSESSEEMDNREQLNISRKSLRALFAVYNLFRWKYKTLPLTDEEIQQAVNHGEMLSRSQEKSEFIVNDSSGSPQFIHSVFAKYIVAYWLYDNMTRVQNYMIFWSQVFWKSNERDILNYFNQIIVRNTERRDIHSAVINQEKTLVSDLLLMDPSLALAEDAAGRLPLHLAATKGDGVILGVLLAHMPNNAINQKDDLFQWTALDYAFVSGTYAAIDRLLDHGAEINIETLCKQLLSNEGASLYGETFHYKRKLTRETDEDYMKENELMVRILEHLINEKQHDINAYEERMGSLTILEFFAKTIKPRFDLQSDLAPRLLVDYLKRFGRFAFETNSSILIHYLANACDFPWAEDPSKQIDALNYCMNIDDFQAFKIIFRQLCRTQQVPCIDDEQIVDVVYRNDELRIAEQYRYPSPRMCCVSRQSRSEITLQIDDDAFVIELLLARAIHGGNVKILDYIIRKLSVEVTYELIVRVLRYHRSLPIHMLYHERSVPPLKYLLDRTTDLYTVDEEGRNLLHVIARDGCFYMLIYLIECGFNYRLINARNQWNVLHYVASCGLEDSDRSLHIFKYLRNLGDMNCCDGLDNEGNSVLDIALIYSNFAIAGQLLEDKHNSIASVHGRMSAILHSTEKMIEQNTTHVLHFFNERLQSAQPDWLEVYRLIIRNIPLM